MKRLWAILLIAVVGCVSDVRQVRGPSGRPLAAQPPVVYVHGEVRAPNCFAWTNGLTAGDAIQLAGGATDFARRRWLEIRHYDGAVEMYRLTSDFRLKRDVLLRPGDQLIMPRICW